MKKLMFCAALGAALVLSACGGGDKKAASGTAASASSGSSSAGSGAGGAAEDAKAVLASAKDAAGSAVKKAADTAKSATDTALAEAVKLVPDNKAYWTAIRALLGADRYAFADAAARLAKDAKPLAEKCFRYELTDDGSGVRILGLSDEGKKDTSPVLAFPATIEGMPVKELVQRSTAFDTFEKIRTIAVVVPEGVEKMSGVKFYGDTDIIVYASLPSSLKEASTAGSTYSLFGGDLCRVDIPSDCKLQEISKDLFNYAKFTSVTIPASVKKIGNDAFQWCENLTSVEIPEGVTEIGTAFWSCKALEKVTLPSTIKSIVGMAFYECSALTEVVIPEGVTIKFKNNDPNIQTVPDTFKGTHLNLKSQTAVKAAGYTGSF